MFLLPPAAEFRFPWEVNFVKEGESLRTFGRSVFHCVDLFDWLDLELVSYHPESSRASLSAQHASEEHQVLVDTIFIEPFNPIIGAQYVVLGEAEKYEGTGVMIRARVLNCVDGVNVALLQKAISGQRDFFRERESKQGDVAQPADTT
uniref:CST complex subunit TEN1 n=1 Tax=Nothobranchius furzeri TaxID=105023 RepID=A0A8C6LQY9_NOTFU